MEILDVSDPSQPTVIGRIELVYGPGHIAVNGDLVFASAIGSYRGLYIIDVSNPTDPTLQCRYGTEDILDVAASGDRVYMVTSPGGLQVLNVLNPAAPTLDNSYPISMERNGAVTVANDLVFVAAASEGLQILR